MGRPPLIKGPSKGGLNEEGFRGSAAGQLACLTGLFSGYFAPVIPPTGGIYSGIAAPLDVDPQNSDMGSKTGEASSMPILGLFAFGDCSVEAAAKKGGIKTVKHLDYRYMNVLFIFQNFTVVAHGD